MNGKRIPSNEARRGMALIPAILIVSGLAVLIVALLTSVLSGQRTVVRENEDYQISSAVESVAMLAAENLWSQYVGEQGGAAGDIESFRNFLTARGIEDAGAGGLPAATDGKDLLGDLALPDVPGHKRFDDVNVDAVHLVRRDVSDATQLFLTVSASTTRGEGIVNPVLNRAVQEVYTVEPAEFPGFEYALLANNVNCIFCHSRVDNAARYWNRASDLAGTFPRVKVGTLETLMLRHDVDGLTAYNDYDSDSFVAGTLYTRGHVWESSGAPITNWGAQSFREHPFDADGEIQESSFGLGLAPFAPATSPLKPLENLYLGYPTGYADQIDGYLPDNFPSPFPDDGGLDPTTGAFSSAGSGNRRVDDNEFHDVALGANGAITAGIVNLTTPGDVIDTALEYQSAVFTGNHSQGLQDASGQGIHGNVVLTGWPSDPIWINGTLAIDGDLVIQGYVKGTGSIYVRGNIYVPTDVMYADGKSYQSGDAPGTPTGSRTFGIAQDGTKNALALTAGGNIVIGDYQRPAALQPDGTYKEPGTYDVVTGNPMNGGKWNFPLSEMAIFNRGEWAKTQQTLPGPSGTTVANPGYIPNYVPRYYNYGKDTIVPIFNKSVYYDPAKQSWMGLETPTAWDLSTLTLANPKNPHDTRLYNADGTPKAVVSTVSQTNGWMAPNVYKMSVEYFEGQHPANTPMQIDGLLYTNNAIFSIVYRESAFAGMMVVNGSIVAADVGMLVPGKKDVLNKFPNHSSLSKYAIGLQLNYDVRLKKALNIKNPFQVQLKRTYWNPTANLL